MVGSLVLACGNAGDHSESRVLTQGENPQVIAVPARPDRATLTPVLDTLGDRRLVVSGTDADLAAVVLRLLRTDRLDVPVGFVPSGTSAVAALWGLPAGAEALDLALRGEPGGVPLIRDDSGGVLLGRGLISPATGAAYCDHVPVLSGTAALEVVPERRDGLAVTVRHRRLLGTRTELTHGRAFQFGGEPCTPVYDGIPHPRQVTRWTWYRHTADLRLIGA